MAKIQIFWKLRQLYSTPLWLYTGKQEYLDINKKSLEAIFFSKNFVHCFLFTKRIIVFFDLFLFDCPILWQLDSTSLLSPEHQYQIGWQSLLLQVHHHWCYQVYQTKWDCFSDHTVLDHQLMVAEHLLFFLSNHILPVTIYYLPKVFLWWCLLGYWNHPSSH